MKKTRQPVVAIIGHIDHGKTTLLSKIREIEMPDEPGKITQNIKAFQVKGITFIDTPGHSAFKSMRQAGLEGADMAILIVAADEGIKAQTREAFKTAQKAKTPLIIAINKIDLPTANPAPIKREFPQNLSVEISAKTGQGLDELLDAIKLQAQELDLSIGKKLKLHILETHHDAQKGEYSDLILYSGKLPSVKRMEDSYGKEIKKALPGMPIRAYGLKNNLKTKFRTTGKGQKIIIKAKNQGSLNAIMDILPDFNILLAGIGNIKEKDLLLGNKDTIVLGFNVNLEKSAQKLAERMEIKIIIDSIIYKLEEKLNHHLQNLQNKKTTKKTKKNIGKIEIIATFKNLEDGMIVGGPVIAGQAESNSPVEIIRENKKIGSGQIKELQHQSKNVKIVEKDKEAGLYLKTKTKIKIGDILKIYQIK